MIHELYGQSFIVYLFYHYRHPSYTSAVAREASLRKYASSPKLAVNTGSGGGLHRPPTNLGPLSSASSMISLKPKKKNSLEEHVNKHMPLRKNQSAPMRSDSKATMASNSRSNSRKATPASVKSVRKENNGKSFQITLVPKLLQ